MAKEKILIVGDNEDISKGLEFFSEPWLMFLFSQATPVSAVSQAKKKIPT